MSVQFIQPRFTERGPRTSALIGGAIGNAAQQAGSLYLQSKMQDYFDQKKEERSATIRSRAAQGLAKAYKRPEWAEVLSGFEPTQQVAVAKQLISTSPESSILQNLITGGKFSAPGQPQQPIPTPASIAASTAAAQRMGVGTQQMPIPGMPEYAQGGAIGQAPGLPMMQPQYQGPMAPQPDFAGGQVTPRPMPSEETGLDLASFQGKKLGEMSDEQMDALKQGQPPEVRKALETTRTNQKNLSARESTAQTARERFEWEKMKDERNYERAKEEAIDKKTEKKIDEDKLETKPLRDHIREIRETLPVRKQNIIVKKESIQRGEIGPFSRSHIASMFGHPELATRDATLMNATIKNLLVENLSALSARAPNIFLEQKFIEALGQLGSPKANNLSVTDMAKFNIDLDEAKIKTYDEVSSKYENDPKIGYFSKDAEREYNRLVEKKAYDLSKKLSYDLQEDLEYESTVQDLTALEKNQLPTPLTEKRKDAIATVAFDAIERKTGRTPTEQEVEQYSKTLAKRYNYILEK